MRNLLRSFVSGTVVLLLLTSIYALAQNPKPAPADEADAKSAFAKKKAALQEAIPAQKPAAVPAKMEIRAGAMRDLAVLGARQNLIDAQVEQWTNQFRPLVRAELLFIRSACNVNKDQRKLLIQESNRVLKETAKKFAESQVGGFRVANGEGQPDPRRWIEDGLAKVVRNRFEPEQVDRFEDEREKRSADRKQVMVRNLAAKLDQELVLSPEQREQITQSLGRNWSKNWSGSQNPEILATYGDQFLPAIPDHVVVPYITAAQRKVWSELPRHNFGMFLGGVHMMMGEAVDDIFLDDDGRSSPSDGAQKPQEKK
jgi:hypothetical protein